MPNDSPPAADSTPEGEDPAGFEEMAEPSDKSLDLPRVRRVPKEPASRVTTVAFSGPIPPPDMLRAYNEINPDLAREIIDLAKVESQHRRELEMLDLKAAIGIAQKEADTRAADVTSDYAEGKRGQQCGVAFGVMALLCATYLGIHHETTAACVIGGGTVVGIVGAFLRKRGAPDPPRPDSPAQQDVAEPGKNSLK